jgi:ubiquinone/menaquinone biosynthesis C-methylase UbiE
MEHYGTDSLLNRVDEALRRAGLGEGIVNWTDLVPLDQFHVRGLAATKELAGSLKIRAGARLLDVGCGLGGPARFLAATYDCRVVGIDLSQPFVDVAAMLTRRCGLADRVECQQADALELPFDDASFQYAWTQHVAMNISNRARFYAEIYRVLEPGGRLAIYDIIAGDGQPLIFPVPWASRPDLSLLLTAEAMRQVLRNSGFVEQSWTDSTEAAKGWLMDLQALLALSPPLGLHVVMGPQFLEMAKNLGRNIQDGRVRLVQVILERPAV